nr:uncharacterized protein LOC122272520 [Parasteatoda tepidariorum]
MEKVCSADLLIFSSNAQFPGSSHDSYVWRNTALRSKVMNIAQQEPNSWLIGKSRTAEYKKWFTIWYKNLLHKRELMLNADSLLYMSYVLQLKKKFPGGSGYPLESWLMVPILDPLEANYNKSHKKTRNPVERCLGVLKARCIHEERLLRYRRPVAADIIYACITLQHICRYHKLPDPSIPERPILISHLPPLPPPFTDVHATGSRVSQQLIQSYYLFFSE